MRVDPTTGSVTHLMESAIRERWARPVANDDGVRVFFERIPERRYARHPVAGVCWIDLNASPSPEETVDNDG